MKPPLRLLQLVHGYPPAVGGVETAVRDVCEGLAARGVEVTVLTTDAYNNAGLRDPRLPRIQEAEEFRNGVRILRFSGNVPFPGPLRVLQSGAWRLRLPGNDRLRTWFHGPVSPGMLRATLAADCDVISAASFPLNHLFYPFRRRDSTPVVLLGSIHPEDAWGYERPSLLGLTRRAYSTVAHTGPERDWLVARGAPSDRVRVIPEGIDPGRARGARGRFRASRGLPADGVLVTFLGQLAEHKGVGELVKSFPALLHSRPDAWLVIAGAPTPYAPRLRSLLASLPEAARSRALLIENVPDQDKPDLLADSDVFASPSRYESFGLTVLEAWANDLPVIAGDSPAMRWVVGAAGVLVPPGDPAKLAEALVRLACDEGVRRELAAAGRDRLERNFTLDGVVDAYLDLYLEAARAANPGP